MSFDDNLSLLERYERWKAEKKLESGDFTPSAFMIDDAKQQAYDKLALVLEEVEATISLIEDGEPDMPTLMEEMKILKAMIDG